MGSQLPSAIMTKSLLFLVFSALSVQACLSYEVTGTYPMRCSTTAGQPCAFPYKDSQGLEVNQCVNSQCPTSLDKDTLEAKEWASCDQSSCVIACSTKSTRQRCVFPFLFDDESDDAVWNRRCAKNKEGTFVCATMVDKSSNVGLEFQPCDLQTCPLD